MATLNFHDEVVEAGELDLPSPQKNPTKRELEMAAKLVESLAAKFEPHKYRDTYRDAVLKVIERKRKGEDIEPPEEPERTEPDDLIAALEASLG
jgi:DNA end-binding protein Ku